jgi:hypothetical protein
MSPTGRRLTISCIAAVGLGLVLRLFFVFYFAAGSGDTPIYEELARNWTDHGVYGLLIKGQLTPVDIRAPGYPAFLAVIHAVFGPSRLPVMLCQILLDIGTCVVGAFLAGRLAPAESRQRISAAALWMTALCPFTANYTAVLLTEVLATFLTMLTLLIAVIAVEEGESMSLQVGARSIRFNLWFWGGLVVGAGTLVRPETPLLLPAVAVVLAWRWRRRPDWPRLVRANLWMAAGLFLVLSPWGARNWVTLGRVQFLAPRYAELPGEFVPRGFMSWTKTWLVRFRDVYLVSWKLEDAPILLEDLPPYAFDSGPERERVKSLLAQYNQQLTITPALDQEFAQLAHERTSIHPLRTFLWIPMGRVATLWFTPRVELLPYSGHLLPLAQEWDEDREDLLVSSGLFFLNILFVGMALLGAWKRRTCTGALVLVSYIVLRTAFLTQIETPEPRYVLVCYPSILVLASLVGF